MKSTPNLTFETLGYGAGFTLTTPVGSSIDVVLPDAPDDYNIGQTSEALVLMVSDTTRATAFMSDNSVVLYLSKESGMPQSFSLAFKNIVSLDVKASQVILHLNNTKIFAEIKDCSIIASDSSSITILMTNSEAQIEFLSYANSVTSVASQSKNISLFSIADGRMIIPSAKRIPEFIISIYDDSDYARPRPSKFGVPVISTVPGFIPDDSWGINTPQEDKDLVELGVGTNTRTMYFKIISDQTIDGSLRDSLSLSIDLPSGVDTVTEAVSVPLSYINSSDTNDIFSGEYVFHKEDTVDFVDGFAYLSVKLPLRIQRNLPLTFQVSNDGLAFSSSLDSIGEVAFVDALSTETNVVQSKIDISKQVTKPSKAKNNKNGKKSTK